MTMAAMIEMVASSPDSWLPLALGRQLLVTTPTENISSRSHVVSAQVAFVSLRDEPVTQGHSRRRRSSHRLFASRTQVPTYLVSSMCVISCATSDSVNMFAARRTHCLSVPENENSVPKKAQKLPVTGRPTCKQLDVKVQKVSR